MIPSQRFIEWAKNCDAITGLILFGSRARGENGLGSADTFSDWDFQIIAKNPRTTFGRGWTLAFNNNALEAYAIRESKIGGVPKINAIIEGCSFDFVVLSDASLRILRWIFRFGLHTRFSIAESSLQNLGVVLNSGFRFVKDGRKWHKFYKNVLADFAISRLSPEDVSNLREGFKCDKSKIESKISRGELIAAQYFIQRDLFDVNLKLLHELRLRRGLATFPDGRRMESFLSADELEYMKYDIGPRPESLRSAVSKLESTCNILASELMKSDRADQA